MTEVWKDVVGYEGRYQVSDLGRVKSLPNKRRKTEIIMKQAKYARTEHRVINLTSEVSGSWKQRLHYVHRLVLEAFRGPCPAGMESCHNDGNPTNNRLNNLRWDTDKSNQADRLKHGTSNRGSQNPSSILNEVDVGVIKTRLKTESLRAIADDYGVSHLTIKAIRNNQNWRHINPTL